MKALIGITAANIPTEDWGGGFRLDRDGQGRLYAESVALAGGLPVILPMIRTPLGESEEYASACGPGNLFENASIYMERLTGLLLSGGGDIAPPTGASEQDKYQGVDRARDIWESALLAAALQMNKPVLGICRGAQLINVALGGSLYADLPSDRPGPVEHQQTLPRARAAHEVIIEPGTRLAGILNEERISVNSGHHQGLRELAPPLLRSAYAPDNLIEAVEHKDADFVIGIQWHPEGHPTAGHSRALFAAFIKAAH